MLLTDDVYGTFVDDFRSLLGELPHNTIGVYSYSKYFGCTGWRLGIIAIHEDNIFDKMIAKLPDEHVKALDKRYGPITLEPRKFKFIDRIVADSRDIGLNHTAGLSLPQQVMMTMFLLCELMDAKKEYQPAPAARESASRRSRTQTRSKPTNLCSAAITRTIDLFRCREKLEIRSRRALFDRQGLVDLPDRMAARLSGGQRIYACIQALERQNTQRSAFSCRVLALLCPKARNPPKPHGEERCSIAGAACYFLCD